MNVETFLRTMPASYSLAFDRAAAGTHARIVSARQGRLAHVALWQATRDSDAVVCVVADDEPGLLSLVCAAFVAHQVDVHAAQIFSRKVEGQPNEAVDFFWVRAFGDFGFEPITEGHVRGITRTLENFVGRARPELEGVVLGGVPASSKVLRTGQIVEFDAEALRHGQSVLVVQAPDSPGLLLSVTRALSAQGVSIAASDVRTTDGVAHDRFTLQRDGFPLSDAGTRERIMRAVRASLDARGTQAKAPQRKVAL